MNILNLTQHVASEAQIEAGVYNPNSDFKAELTKLLTFKWGSTSKYGILSAAIEITQMANQQYHPEAVMIGGAPYLMGPLAKTLSEAGIRPLFAFSERVSEEDPETGMKVSVFKHLGFVDGT